ncbi:hypothetical protein DFH94DRAFT_641753 [Russula ochroleuca]|uniref:Uncharacterized protein n=1 Tax=Russula ochroleuca TaxID=152965 RepID=A0A9P5N6I4_9AGAM|nr:hypothetical protein DFH94DRAFT_641753 [Russula ochroleuca]
MEATVIGLRPSPSGAKTADTRPQPRTPHSPSYIPLFSPKATRSPPPSSSLPSSLSVPHLGLVPPNRTPSGSGPPPQSAIPQPSSSSAHASGGTSLPSLRALRSFLPFGSGKTPSSSITAVPGPSKNPFANFTPGRRSSINIERKNSGQFPRSGDENDAAVIISIASPSQEKPPQTQGSTGSADAREPSLPSLSASDEEVGPPVVTFKPDPPLSTELSTILESDLSGLSKHLPALDQSQISDFSGNGHSIDPEALCPSPEISELVAPDASVLDLSTSQLKEEVMHALKEKPSTNGWLTGVVVEDAADSRPPSRNDRKELEFDAGEEPEESLHLDALDSDLAALLSSNRSGVKQPIFRTENPFTSTLIPQQPQATVPPRIFPPPRTVTPQSRPSPLASSPVDASPSSTIGSSRSQPSPVRTTAPHGFSSLPRSGPSRFMPRIMRSVTERVTPVRGDRNVENVARAPSDPMLPMDDGRRVSSDSVYPRRSPASPLPFEGQPPLPPLPHSNSEPLRRVAPSRLATPARFGAHAPAGSRLLRSALPSTSGSWGKDSPSPTSRASSALGSTVDRQSRPRTSEDGVLEGRPSARERLGYTPRSRNRSLSVGGGGNGERVTSPGPRSTEWLGPRTAKAFAAAGLLDRDVNINANNNASRFGSVRSLGDRDQRTLAPSRLAVSEAGSVASSWRSGSVSRAMTHSEATGHDSASTSTGAPRTTRSADSTAPTSMQSRTPSPQHKNYQVALQAMQEKHATETGTLLAALADAQQNAQSLRAENAKLVARIDDLEAELVDTRTQLRAHMYASPSPSSSHLQPPFGRAMFSRMERQASADAVAMTTTTRRRPPLPLPVPISGHPQGSSSRVVDLKRLEDADEESATFQMGGGGRPSRRASWTESLFSVPPPNMSMLLQELPAGSRRSVGSVSMTTASAPTDAPGSPRSLFLRPEHELHLGDLGGLDMRFTEDEADDAGDED